MNRRRKINYEYEGEPPHKEMSWCIANEIIVCMDRYAEVIKGKYYERDLYRIVVKYGNEDKKGDYKYTHKNIINAVWNAWIRLYKINNGKEEKIR